MRASISRSQFLATVIAGLLVFGGASPIMSQQATPRSPSDTVREFYKAMREKRFREAFAISIYKPAIDGLTQQEFDDLRQDFERLAVVIPEKVDIAGEQISGEGATVFIRTKDPESGEQAEPVSLIRVDGNWIVGDRENQAIVIQDGKEFFFKARIVAHHNDVQEMLRKIALAQLIYSQQHNREFGDLAALIAGGLVPRDLEGTLTTGYRFHVSVTADKKSWSAAAEPAQYGRTGKLSFAQDASGVRSGDVGGKPLPPTTLKN